MHKLVLLRHGQSQWNLENRFTGWTDVDLTQQGIAEARESARLLTAEEAATESGCVAERWLGSPVTSGREVDQKQASAARR